MEYQIANQNNRVFAKNIAEERIEETLSFMRPDNKIFIVAAKLPISFTAKVVRESGKEEVVKIEYAKKSLSLLRNTTSQKGDIGVSCSPEGEEAAVDTFNVEFRNYNDDLTDRGIIWLHPGNPASFQLIIKRKALEMPGRVQEIIKEAKSALSEKLLDRFDLALL